MLEDGLRNDDAPGVGHGLESGSNVDTVAIEIAALDHDVTEVDADAQHDVAILEQIRVGGFHTLLQLDRALHRVNGAAELHKRTIAGDLEDAALVHCYQRLEHILAACLECG